MTNGNETMRLAAVADIHYGRTSQGTLTGLFAHASANADVLLLCGDLTDYGLPEEAQTLAKDLTASLKIPAVAVLGNHDYESGQPDEVRQILVDAGVRVLDGDSCEVCGVGFAGVKGFAGGFGRGTLGYWGEATIKRFVQEAIDEALKLETALARLRTERRIAVLHYAPIQATVKGEPPEISPYLGTSRREEPRTRYPVTAVFHGHAHHGTFAGRTVSGVPVYNVSLSLLQQHFPDAPPVYIMALPTDAAAVVDRQQAAAEEAGRRAGG
jgi:Icc-related predicted phosphoesterase